MSFLDALDIFLAIILIISCCFSIITLRLIIFKLQKDKYAVKDNNNNIIKYELKEVKFKYKYIEDTEEFELKHNGNLIMNQDSYMIPVWVFIAFLFIYSIFFVVKEKNKQKNL